MAEVSSLDVNGSFTQATTTNTVPLGQWTHVGFVRTVSSITWYINGVAQSVTTGGNASPSGVTNISTNAPMRIGVRDEGAIGTFSSFFGGQLDQIVVHNRALTAAEIQDSMAGNAYTQTAGTLSVSGELVSSAVNIQGGSIEIATPSTPNPAPLHQWTFNDGTA